MSALPNLAPQKTLRVGLFTHWQGTWAGFYKTLLPKS